MKFENPLFVTVAVTSEAQLASVYALLGGVLGGATLVADLKPVPKAEPAKSATAHASAGTETSAQENQAQDGPGPNATTAASPSDDGVVDAAGWPWSAELHAATKGTTKDGLWRMKVGVARPDPKPGFPVETGGTGTKDAGTALPAGATAASEPAGQADDDDEFAAFRAAAAKSDAVDATAKANVPPRKYTDADLGALCNQAATKLGDPAPVREIIAGFIPEGEVAHSRNIPEDKRADFVAAVELKAGITFAS